MEIKDTFLLKMEDLVKQVVGYYNIACYHIDATMEAHHANDGEKVSVPVIRLVGFFEDTVSKLTQILNAEFDMAVIKDSNTAANDMFLSAAQAFSVGLKPNRLELPEYRAFANQKVEIRVSSILQDVYASMQKELLKGKSAIPANVTRDFYRVGALIEMADIELVKIRTLVNAGADVTVSADNAQPAIPEVTRATKAISGNNGTEHQATTPATAAPLTEQIKATTNETGKNKIDTSDTDVDSFNSLGVSLFNNENSNGNGYPDLLKPHVSEEVSNATVPDSATLNVDKVGAVNGIEHTAETIRDGADKRATKQQEDAKVNISIEEVSQMNELMLKEYVANSKLVKEVDRMIAERAGATINDEIDIEGDVERLRFLKVFTLKQLQEKIADNKEEIVAFAEKWIGKDNGGSFDSGICLFYLEYLLVGKKGDPAFAVEYVLKFISDNDYSARYIIPTYNSIRQTEPSSFAHLTLK